MRFGLNQLFFACAALPLVACGDPGSTTYEPIDDGMGTQDVLPDAGAPRQTSGRVGDGLQLLYTFEEGTGIRVRDTSGAGEPWDLTIDDPVQAVWGQGFLSLGGPTRVQGLDIPTKLIEKVAITQEMSLEAWVRTADLSQNGAQIIRYGSSDTRNFSLSQVGDKLQANVRSSDNPDGTLQSEPTSAELVHVVFTRDSLGRTTLYIDGYEEIGGDSAGSLDTWDLSAELQMGNSIQGNAPWLGSLYLIAVYSQALAPGEVTQNFFAGP